MKEALRAIADRVLPGWTREWRAWRWLAREAAQIEQVRRQQPSLETVLGAVMDSAAFRPQQRPREILSLLRLLEQQPPRRVLEVGGRRGGTLLLFAAVSDPQARLLSIDLAYSPVQRRVAPRLAGPRQEVACWAADSHAATTVERVAEWLQGEALDFLFIDGDHSLAGVSKDFELLAPFVRAGGTIAFHDIVPDSLMRHGVPSASCVGEVPLFWRQLKARDLTVTEFIDDPEQDGMGIGVIRLTPEWMDAIVRRGC